MKRLFPLSFLCACALLLTLSCNLREELDRFNDVKIPNWQAEIAAPLVTMDFSIQDFLDKFSTGGFFEVDNNGILTIVYRGQVFSSRGREIFKSLDLKNLPVIFHKSTIPVSFSGNARMDAIHLKTGVLSYSFTAPAAGSVRIKLPTVTSGATVMDQTIAVAGAGLQTGSFSLDGFDLNFNNNTFPFEYTVDGDTAVSLTGMTLSFETLKFNSVDGYFGNIGFKLPLDTINLDLFSNFQLGSIIFDDPYVALNIRSSFGMPLRAVADTFAFKLKTTGEILPLSNQLSSGIELNYPRLPQKGQFATTQIILDKNSSNLSQIIAGIPTSFYYNFAATANPDGDTGEKNFILDSSYFAVDVDVKFPLKGKITEFVVNQDFVFKFNSYDQVDHARLKFITENQFPLDVALQVFFMDENGNATDSILTWQQGTNTITGKLILAAADVDANGRTIGSKEEVTYFDMTAERIAKLKAAKYLRVRGAFATLEKGTKTMAIYPDYRVAIRIGVIGGANIPIGK